jgi:hypothetical protein
MHNRNSEASGIGRDFDVEQAQHQTVAIDVSCAVVLSNLFH